MVEKTKNYVERGSWEEDLTRMDDTIDRLCILVITAAVLYFGPAVVQIIVREVAR